MYKYLKLTLEPFSERTKVLAHFFGRSETGSKIRSSNQQTPLGDTQFDAADYESGLHKPNKPLETAKNRV